jgi:soluble lytic murein transglycosylase-like protein
MRVLSVALLVWLATVVPATAQIYSWHDEGGRLVLSNAPKTKDAHIVTYAVPGTTIRTANKPAATVNSRAALYDDLIRQYAERHGVSPDLVRAVIQAESAFNPRAVSPKGAMGLMQLMPATARDLGVSNPFHPEENIRGGVTYLASLLTRFNQDVVRALAAYNAGAARVDQYNGVPPYRETQAYVKKITEAASVAPPKPPEPVIYKFTELVNGEPKIRYSNIKPVDLPYEIVGKR